VRGRRMGVRKTWETAVTAVHCPQGEHSLSVPRCTTHYPTQKLGSMDQVGGTGGAWMSWGASHGAN
jgi:hypothetical protein